MKLCKLNPVLAIVLLSTAICLSGQSATLSFDIVITNGHIIDGTGSPWYSGDIGIRDGRVVTIGNLSAAARKRTIDAAGKVVAPGFIDMLGQSDLTILVDPRVPSKIYQGITTEITGEGGKFGGIYSTHMRNESDSVLEAIDEALRIGREAHVPVEIWHIKVAGKSNWGRMPEVVAKINAARAGGADITADTYAYTAWFNDLSAFVPPWAHDGGTAKLVERLKDAATRERIRKDLLTSSTKWDNEWQEIPGPEAVLIGIVQNPKMLPLEGKRLSEIAKLWNKDPMDALFDFLIEDPGAGVAVFGMSQADVTLALQQPWVAIDNDSSGTSPEGILGQEHPHPRAYGTFPRILRKYVREDKALTLEDAIRKMTALPAQRLRLADRGVLKTGMWADVVIFDPATVRDLATFDSPNQLSEGMDYVLVNGVPVIEQSKMTGALPGRVLRGAGYVP